MVRRKQRYLLIGILYPLPASSDSNITSDGEDDHLAMLEFHRPSPSKMTEQELLRAIKDSIQLQFGQHGLDVIGRNLQVKYWSTATSTAIVRIDRDQEKIVRAAISYMTHLPRPWLAPCVFHIVRVSGTIQLAEKAAIEHGTSLLRRARALKLASQGNLVEALGFTAEASEPRLEGHSHQDRRGRDGRMNKSTEADNG